jgi:protein-S-isoprenylcysteine O-methyltransferase Ste14
MPPLLFFLAVFLAGMGMHRAVPIRVLSNSIVVAGGALLGIGSWLAVMCVLMFFKSRTTVIPHGTPSRLIASGPYRYSRNPMYVSLVVIHLGAALVLREIWPLLLVPLPLAVLQRFVIPFEEARLREQFGSEYEQYRRRVRRWL